ncbi:MAG: L,D-transpeptidase family protein, partial [Ruminococcus sp.]|nr:L,D-transpeptidase family protein [Ruminococcus sp.]
KGSAIFLHCLGDRKPRTGGCVAVPEEQMYYIMQHVDPDCVVVIDSMENLGAEF